MTLIVDYKMGNLGSIKNMLRKIGEDVEITSDPIRVARAERLILPGVGRFDRAMENLRQLELRPALEAAVFGRLVPTLGICLGMQLMTRRSEEGDVEGLSWMPGDVKRFRFPSDEKLTVPHMGWNDLKVKNDSPLFRGLEGDSRFYFVHSYYVSIDDPAQISAETEYGHSFVSAFRRGNLQGVQFHPEKSHRFGQALLRNFIGGAPR
ncbi:MAG: imidazole glycerol phosphate synthase subunit HisH [Bdellovibrionaceae bacterium]|nr:imidazole glycerol phosphate synthase subunit HisH [Pseudobdellovibrionaceae bacterium]